MRNPLPLGICTFLGLLPSFSLAADPPTDNAEPKPITIQAQIDGRSRLLVRGNTLWWYHIDFTAPGRHGDPGTDKPTLINGEPWQPKWPDTNGPANEFAYCESSRFERLDPPLPLSPLKVDVDGIEARGQVRVLQQPAKANDYTLIVEIDDAEIAGSTDYALQLTPMPADEPQPATKADSSNLRRGLVAEYLFNDGTPKDTSDKHLDAKPTDVTPAADRFGRPNAAMSFNGKTSSILIQPAPALSPAGVSVSLWVKFDKLPQADWNSGMLCQDNGHDRRAYQLSMNGRHAVWHRMHQFGWDPVGLAPLQDQKWYHLVATSDGRQNALYVNGVLQETMDGSFTPVRDEPLWIGRKGSDEKQFFFAGTLDDIRIWDRPLSQEEVTALYKEPTP